jgi:hypothetical protein
MPLASGNVLITDPGNRRVIEVDRAGKIVWSYDGQAARHAKFKPYSAERLTNGNTLIADQTGEQVLEVTPAGAVVVWSYPGVKFVCDARRLPGGNTLITTRTPPRVIEVTPEGEIVWSKQGLHLPWSARRLPDGTTMVAENFSVNLYDRNGKVVRKLPAEWAASAEYYGK